MSHLLQMRGLKHLSLDRKHHRHSRIFYRCVDWNIAMLPSLSSNRSRIFYRCVDWNHDLINKLLFNTVASFTDAWIETPIRSIVPKRAVSHLLQMRGLKRKLDLQLFFKRCRIFYRCVDWNKRTEHYKITQRVASFTDAWIETQQQ